MVRNRVLGLLTAIVLIFCAAQLGWAEGAGSKAVVPEAQRLLEDDQAAEALHLLEGVPEAERSQEVEYTRGRALMDLRRFDEAAAAFRASIALDPSFFEGKLSLGVLLYREGRYEDAKEALNSALEDRPSDPQALYWAGATSARLGEPEKAGEFFAASAAGTPDAFPLERPLTPEPERSQSPGGKGLILNAWFGITYNDNVTLAADDGSTTATGEDDFIGTVSILGSLPVVTDKVFGLNIYYAGYNSAHGSHEDFNIQHNRLGAIILKSFGRPRASLDVAAEYTFVGRHGYRGAVEFAPALAYQVSGRFRERLDFSLRYEHYFPTELSTDNDQRTGQFYRVGYRADWKPLPPLSLTGDVGLSMRTARENEREHEGADARFNGEYRLSEQWRLYVFGAWESRNYDRGPSWPAGRDEDLFDVGSAVGWKLSEKWTFRFDYRYHRTNSTADGYTYDQNVLRINAGFSL